MLLQLHVSIVDYKTNSEDKIIDKHTESRKQRNY